MGVYIKGIEMPKTCLDCPCFDLEYAECEVTNVTATRENGCPLVEVPEPHGRLIDADKLPIADISVEYYKIYGVREDDITNAPTVIEAEEQEHE